MPSLMFLQRHSPPTYTSTLSLHDALPIWLHLAHGLFHMVQYFVKPFVRRRERQLLREEVYRNRLHAVDPGNGFLDRKSTRLNSSHVSISYAVFCLKKKKRRYQDTSLYTET